ncbi:MAG: hypothetical protein HMLIMOIP_002723 [Candidatus Nitrosomirales archaeon]|jgi:hypothetical protein
MKSKARFVSETNRGIYVWRLPNGDFLAEGLNVLSIDSVRGDIQKMAAITRAAKEYGYPEGAPVFVEGNRKITDEEFEIQYERMLNGLIPDPYDIGNLQDEVRRSGR